MVATCCLAKLCLGTSVLCLKLTEYVAAIDVWDTIGRVKRAIGCLKSGVGRARTRIMYASSICQAVVATPGGARRDGSYPAKSDVMNTRAKVRLDIS